MTFVDTPIRTRPNTGRGETVSAVDLLLDGLTKNPVRLENNNLSRKIFILFIARTSPQPFITTWFDESVFFLLSGKL